MYSTYDYGVMIADTVRMNAYTQALAAVIKPGMTVVDIGTGTGIFAFLACQYGAARVIAIEPNENIHVAKKLANENGFLDRIEFIQDLSTKVNLSDRADVIISDLRGKLPFHGKHIPTVIDARQRLLKPGGILIPRRDTLYACIVEASELYREHADPWVDNPYDLNLEQARILCVNTWSTGRVKENQMLTSKRTWGVLDYYNVKTPDLDGSIRDVIVRDGVAHGLMIWFDAEILDGVGFSNAPDCTDHPKVYGSAFFPFHQPVHVMEGDLAAVDIKTVLIDEEYTWRWNTKITSQDNVVRAKFEQSTFYGSIFSPEHLRKRQPGYLPKLNSGGLLERFILMEMDGKNSIEIIAKKAYEIFPDCFTSLEEAIKKIGDVSQKYGY
jgi:type I protein arginine methyltransferase